VVDRPSTVHPSDDGTGPSPSGLSLVVIGCDGSWTGPGGAGSGYLVTSGTTRVLMDAGPGTFANLQRHVDPASIDAVTLSHQHPDHWTDLYSIATHARLALDGRSVPVYAPAGLAERTHLEMSPVIAFHEVTHGDSVRIGSLTCAFHRTDHPVETLAVRIDGGGRALGYSADTGPEWSLAELGTGLDLVLSEATYTCDHEGTSHHMSGRQAGNQARRAGARRLVVTHRWPTVSASALEAEATLAFGSRVEVATIGKEYVL
jgi:ribonuclease BN (tRNA processing enzyme)